MAQFSREQAPIDSPSNQTVRLLRDLRDPAGRREHGAFLIEGTRIVAEALEAAWSLRAVLYDASRTANDSALATLVSGLSGALPATARAIRHAADTVSPQGIVAAAALPARDVAIDAAEPLVLVIDALSDPGNIGTLLRSALGAGVRTVLVSRGGADPFSPKVVRGAMGAHFRLQLATDLDWTTIRELLGPTREIVVADSSAPTPYYVRDWSRASALVIGNEAHGPGAEAVAAAATAVSIPLDARVESLNAAVAGSVIMFEAKRQRT